VVKGSQWSWFRLRALLRCACWSLDLAFEEMDLEKLMFDNYIDAPAGYAVMEIVTAVSTTALEKGGNWRRLDYCSIQHARN
jgi:hypothetical protein